MLHHKLRLAIALACPSLVVASNASGNVIGFDGFDYPDGALVPADGGTGWFWNNSTGTQGPIGGVAPWYDSFETGAQVVDGAAQTQNNGPARQFNNDWGAAAFQGSGTFFISTELTYQPGASWLGLSVMDFGGERFKFGAVDTDLGSGTRKYFGIESLNADGLGLQWYFSNVEAVAGETYRVVGSIDYEGDAVRLWIDPAAGEEASPDLTLAYTGGNWSTGLRLGSGGTAPTIWDNVYAGTTFASVIPEPASLGLVAAGAALMLVRRR